MTPLRRVPTIDPAPADVLTAETLTRPSGVQSEARVAAIARYWMLGTDEVKGLLFVRSLIEDGRIGKGDRN